MSKFILSTEKSIVWHRFCLGCISLRSPIKKFFNFAYFIQKRFILNKLSSIFRNLEIYFAPSAFFLFDSRLNSLQTRIV